MASLYRFPTSHSLSSCKFRFTFPFPLHKAHINDAHELRCFTIFASSSKKRTRGSRKVKSNAELCNDIREFLSSVGLPQNHLPSMKELSQHGRQDLANLVRRRGYRIMRQLLENSAMTTNFIGSNTDTVQIGKPVELSGSEGQNEELKILAYDVASDETVREENFPSCLETNEELNLNDRSSFSSESTALSLQEKVARFIQHGELDIVHDGDYGIMNGRHADDEWSCNKSEDAHEPEYATSHPQQGDLMLPSSSASEIVNGNIPTSVPEVEDPVLGNNTSRNSCISTEEQRSFYSDKDLDSEKLGSEADMKRLKFLLHQKESELTQLKQQIEKEKIVLSTLQTKAETEISKAQRLISEKETELQVAEESLSGLKEVEIQYSGDGDTVELAGSFNGWHHKIKMDELPSSSISDLAESRTSRLWRAVLWLYPGVYEIKFIVDGHWRIDAQRESITRNSVHNNILRVDR